FAGLIAALQSAFFSPESPVVCPRAIIFYIPSTSVFARAAFRISFWDIYFLFPRKLLPVLCCLCFSGSFLDSGDFDPA
ncbi:hypothetical protein ACQWE9_26140, partial [Salmonella enterica subsp. enterica serovar Infantis]